MSKKTISITPVALTIISLLVIILTGTTLFISYRSFLDGASDIYEEMDRNITAAALSAVDNNAMHELAYNTYETYKSIKNPKELYETDPEAYYAYFENLQNSDMYRETMDALNEVRIGTSSTALSYVILVPGKNYCVYIIDASSDNIIPLGSLYDIDTSQYVGSTNREFKGYISESDTYGLVHTDGFYCCTYESEGIYSYLLSDIPFTNVLNRAHTFILQAAGLCLIITIIVFLLINYLIQKHFLRPLTSITNTSKNFVETYKDNSTNNVFDDIYKGKIRELQDLSSSLKTMETDLNTYVSDLETLTEEKTRLSTELKLAESIQSDMLPNIFPAFPERSEFDIFASMDPAREVGGDFYDFFLIDKDHLALVMADVSGKGIPAALFMMMSKILIKNCAMLGISPSEVLERVNNLICQNNKNDMFVTVWFGIFDIPGGMITCANAGHEYPIFKRAGGQFEIIKDRHGFVIGSMPNMKYKEYTLQFHNGDTLFVYTDGLPEATDKNSTLFGMERIIESLNRDPARPSKELLKDMTKDVDEFLQGAPQFDDLTMLAIQGIDIPEADQKPEPVQ